MAETHTHSHQAGALADGNGQLKQGPLGEAPWKQLFMEHVSKMPSPEFVMATLEPTAAAAAAAAAPADAHGQQLKEPHTDSTTAAAAARHDSRPQPPPSPPPVDHQPRLRYLIFRGMWGELPDNPRNEAPRNARAYASDMPTFTTDVRMEKVPQLFATGRGHGAPAQAQSSGGGGLVEAVWWVKETMTQWRMRGEAYVIAPDIESGSAEGGAGPEHEQEEKQEKEGGKESSGVRTVKSEIGKRMRLVQEDGDKHWSWGRELTAHFGNMSPIMRGSFKNPPPGTPVSSKGSLPDGVGLGQKVSDLHDPIARQNFRVVVIRPAVVEQLDLSDPEASRRFRYTFVQSAAAAAAAAAATTSSSSSSSSSSALASSMSSNDDTTTADDAAHERVVAGWRIQELWP